MHNFLESILGCGNIQEGNMYYITNQQYGCVIDMSGGNCGKGNEFQSLNQRNETAQTFYIKQVPSTNAFLILSHCNMSFDIQSSRLVHNTSDCSATQKFTFVDGPDNTCLIYSFNTNNVLQMSANPACTGSSVPIISAPISGAGNVTQQWYFQQITSKCKFPRRSKFYEYFFIVCLLFSVSFTPSYPSCASANTLVSPSINNKNSKHFLSL